MAQFSNNPEYIPHDIGGHVFYTPSETTSYHKSREMAMQAQDIFSRCGISREVLQSFVKELLERANGSPVASLRTDVGVIANNLQYRLNNISDSECALKMGAIACFIEGENPDTVHEAWTQKKIALARSNTDVFDFFFHLGVACTPEYATHLRGLMIRGYLETREETLRGLTLQSTQIG